MILLIFILVHYSNSRLFCLVPLSYEKDILISENHLFCKETEHYFMQLFLWLCKLFDQRGLDIPP